MKRVRQPGADRITNLPADVIHRILVLLPIKDAAKTSVLSTKWMYQWRSIPQLVFDNRFARIPIGNESESRMRSKLIMLNIYKALLVHHGPITKFVLAVPGLYSCNDEIDLMAIYLSDKGVRDFALLNYYRLYNVRDCYQVHSSLFSALHLESLRPEACAFTPPTQFAGFSRLTHLALEYVILPSHFFENFLPKCPMLQHLRVRDCAGPRKLEIVAPLLKSFSMYGSSLDICFKCTPLLSHVLLHLSKSKPPDMVSLFASLPALQWFSVHCGILKLSPVDGNVLTRLPTPLHQLKVLHLYDAVFGCPETGRILVCLIMNSPNLHRLFVEVSGKQADEQDQPANSEVSSIRRFFGVEDCPGFSNCLPHLRRFTIDYFHDERFQMADYELRGTLFQPEVLVRFVLATAPLLQRLLIVPPCEASSETMMKFMKDVMRYKRVPKDAEVIYDSDDIYEGDLSNEFLA